MIVKFKREAPVNLASLKLLLSPLARAKVTRKWAWLGGGRRNGRGVVDAGRSTFQKFSTNPIKATAAEEAAAATSPPWLERLKIAARGGTRKLKAAAANQKSLRLKSNGTRTNISLSTWKLSAQQQHQHVKKKNPYPPRKFNTTEFPYTCPYLRPKTTFPSA